MEPLFKLNIPDDEYPTLAALANMAQENFESLVKGIQKTPATYHPRQFADNLQSNIDIPDIDIEEIIRIVLSLHGLRNHIQTTTDNLIPILVDAFIEKDNHVNNEYINTLKNRLDILMRIYNPLSISASAFKVSLDSERCVSETNAFLDLRPIFNDDTQELLSNVILYRLKIIYSLAGEKNDMNFTFDLSDIMFLRKQLDSIIEKSNKLKNQFHESNIVIIDSNP